MLGYALDEELSDTEQT